MFIILKENKKKHLWTYIKKKVPEDILSNGFVHIIEEKLTTHLYILSYPLLLYLLFLYHSLNIFLDMDSSNMSSLLLNSSNLTTANICMDAPPMFKGFDEFMVALYILVIAVATPGNAILIFVVSRNPNMQV